MTPLVVDELVPMAFVADLGRSIAFYGRLGFTVDGTSEDVDGKMTWAELRAGAARLFISQATAPVVAEAQAVLFYCYCRDVRALREDLLSAGVPAGEVVERVYMPAGELRLEDPDGYVLLVGQLERS